MNARYWPCSEVHSADHGAIDIVGEVNLFLMQRTVHDEHSISRDAERRRAHSVRKMLGRGRSQVREVKRAQIMLAADQGQVRTPLPKRCVPVPRQFTAPHGVSWDRDW
jgi:hypothetical protein